MKYKLFCGLSYYPCGGYEDFKGSFSSIGEAKLVVEELYRYNEWAHIVLDDKIIRMGRKCVQSPWQWKLPLEEWPPEENEADKS